jgi:hypothetical protein
MMMPAEPTYTFIPSDRESRRQQFGAVIVFPEGMDQTECEKVIQNLEQQYGVTVEGPKAFNPDHGEPVWYVP